MCILLKTENTFAGQIHVNAFILAASRENLIFAYAETKELISAFVLATYTYTVQSLCSLNPKFEASRHFLRLHSPVCDRFSHGVAPFTIHSCFGKSFTCCSILSVAFQT